VKLAIMQPYFLPYIGYFQLINAVNKFILFDDVNYIKKGWINRNRILLNNEEYMFTVPLEKVSQNKKINEINLVSDAGWKAKLLKTFKAAYEKAPMFGAVYPIITNIINFDESNLSAYLGNSINKICEYLNIKSCIVNSSVPYNTAEYKGQDKIIEICRQEKAVEYINPIGGTDLYQYERFAEEKIKLFFLKSNPIAYKQFNTEYISGLSILDVIMFNDKKRVSSFLNEYTLV
jgi:hypothetical protein